MPFYINDLRTGAMLIEESRNPSTQQPTPNVFDTVDAFDPTYGQCSFICLTGVASTAIGDVVIWDSAGQTTRAITTSRGPIAVAMSANGAGNRGWYMIKGRFPVTSGANAVAANAPVQCSAAGTIDDTTTAGQFIDGMTSRAANSGGFTLCEVNFPTMNGR